MTEEVIRTTTSLCPECLIQIPAEILNRPIADRIEMLEQVDVQEQEMKEG